MEHQLTLLFHFLGFGLLMSINVAGLVLNSQYRNAADFQTKAVIVRAMRPIGLLSPIGFLIMLITGIDNMHVLGLGILDAGWLTAKIIFFAIAAISGILFGAIARKRGKLVMEIASGSSPANASETLRGYDRQISLFYIVMPILMLIIVWLSIYGRVGGS